MEFELLDVYDEIYGTEQLSISCASPARPGRSKNVEKYLKRERERERAKRNKKKNK